MGWGYRESYRKLFMDLKILPLSSHYIFSILFFVVNNREYFTPNSTYHRNNTRQRTDLHLPQVTLAVYQKGVYYSSIKIFNTLPKALKDIYNEPNKFKTALMHFLHIHSFYSLNEFYNIQWYLPCICMWCITFMCMYSFMLVL